MNSTISKFTQNKVATHVTVGVLTGAAGFAIGYIVGKRNGEVFNMVSYDDYSTIGKASEVVIVPGSLEPDGSYEVASNETDATPDVEESVGETFTTEQLEEKVSEIAQLVKTDYARISAPEKPAPQFVSIFSAPAQWDYETEFAQRSPDRPYVIHQEEYMNEEMGYRQETVTYYAGDDILADAKDTPIYNRGIRLGTLLFGHGSNDKSVVYIRNEAEQMEWEVLRHDGSFELEVLGLEAEQEIDAELRHASPLKFKRD